MVGLVLLVLVSRSSALAAPLLADADGLTVTKATGPMHRAALLGLPAGHRRRRPLGADHADLGQPHLAAGRASPPRSSPWCIGTLVGIAAGHFRGLRGGIFTRLTEWFLVIPYLPLAIVLGDRCSADACRKLVSVIIVIGVTVVVVARRGWCGRRRWPSRAGRTWSGPGRSAAGHWHQMTRHVLPNVMPLVFANTTLTVSVAVLAETTLSFLGLGDPLHVSWGTILDEAYTARRHHASAPGGGSIFPGVAW